MLKVTAQNRTGKSAMAHLWLGTEPGEAVTFQSWLTAYPKTSRARNVIRRQAMWMRAR